MVARLNGKIERADDDGLVIRLEGNPGFSEGERVTAQVEKSDDDWPRRRENIMKHFGVWKDDEEIGRIFDEIIEERNQRLPRDVEL